METMRSFWAKHKHDKIASDAIGNKVQKLLNRIFVPEELESLQVPWKPDQFIIPFLPMKRRGMAFHLSDSGIESVGLSYYVGISEGTASSFEHVFRITEQLDIFIPRMEIAMYRVGFTIHTYKDSSNNIGKEVCTTDYGKMLWAFQHQLNPLQQIETILVNGPDYRENNEQRMVELPLLDHELLLREVTWITESTRGFLLFLPLCQEIRLTRGSVRFEKKSSSLSPSRHEPKRWATPSLDFHWEVSLSHFRSWRRYLCEKYSGLLLERIDQQRREGKIKFQEFFWGIRSLLEPSQEPFKRNVRRKLEF